VEIFKIKEIKSISELKEIFKVLKIKRKKKLFKLIYYTPVFETWIYSYREVIRCHLILWNIFFQIRSVIFMITTLKLENGVSLFEADQRPLSCVNCRQHCLLVVFAFVPFLCITSFNIWRFQNPFFFYSFSTICSL